MSTNFITNKCSPPYLLTNTHTGYMYITINNKGELKWENAIIRIVNAKTVNAATTANAPPTTNVVKNAAAAKLTKKKLPAAVLIANKE